MNCLECGEVLPPGFDSCPYCEAKRSAPPPSPPTGLPKGMVACPVCKMSVSRQARSCPHCGRPRPATSDIFLALNSCGTALLWLGLAAFLLLLYCVIKAVR
jgi:RNA polymerase subunit RPABC4/transcription elongation factor Spt4